MRVANVDHFGGLEIFLIIIGPMKNEHRAVSQGQSWQELQRLLQYSQLEFNIK